MKNRKYPAVLALLLAIIMTFTACGGTDPKEELPVTAEAKFSNFIKIEGNEENPLRKVTLMTETHGEVIATYENSVLFYKESKDKLNNLTQTYQLYSISEGKTLLTVTNAYPDEYGWVNDFGHVTRPEKEIGEVSFMTTNGVHYLAVEWITRTPISNRIIEDEHLEDSYIEDYYYDFYDIYGTFIATSGVAQKGTKVKEKNDYTLLSFGKTVAIFDEDDKLVDAYNGDTATAPTLYDHTNDTYNYILGLPNGATDNSFATKRTSIKVYDKEGNLVLDYAHGDHATYSVANVLESGDILIQQLLLARGTEYDFEMGDTRFNVETFIIDVETGKTTALESFRYMIKDSIAFAEDFDKAANGSLAATENVRNIAVAQDLETKKERTIFFDNLGNVNFAFDGILCYEAKETAIDKIKVLDKTHILLSLYDAADAKYAIIDNNGKLITYVPDGAYILEDYIVTDKAVYNFSMEKIRDLNSQIGSYDEGSLTLKACFGNVMLFTATRTVQYSDQEPEITTYTILYNISSNYVNSSSDTTIVNYSQDGVGGYILTRTEAATGYLYHVVNGDADTVFTAAAASVSTRACEDAIFVLVDFDGDGKTDNTYMITESAVTSSYDDYDDYDDQTDKE